MNDDMSKGAIPTRLLVQEIENLELFLENANGRATAKDLVRLYALGDLLVQEKDLDCEVIGEITGVARCRLSSETLEVLSIFPPVIQARILYILTCSERQVVWEAEGGTKNLPAEAFNNEKTKKEMEDASWRLQQALNIGEAYMYPYETEVLRSLRDRLTEQANGLPVLHVDSLSGFHISRAISDAHPWHRPYLLRRHIQRTKKTGPNTMIYRTALVRRLATLMAGIILRKRAEGFVSVLFNEFHAPNPSVMPITASQVKHDLHDRH